MTGARDLQAYVIAQRALEELRALALEPNVTNFAVWTTHLARTHPSLSQTIDGMRDGAAAITGEALQSLYYQHLISDSEDILDLGDAVSSKISKATEALSDAGVSTERYGDALDGASVALKATEEPYVVQTLVRTLIQATRNMRERTRDLEVRLAETSGEVRALRNNLSKVREEALTDPLTGVANRKRFDEALEEMRTEAIRKGSPLCLVMCDIDNFKRVNDAWGHNVGDQVIRFIASTLASHAPPDWLVARYGGEEFAIVAPDAKIDVVLQVAEQARASIESKVLRRRTTNETLGHVTASFGVALFEPEEPRWKFVERADAALYASKNAGRNKVSAQAA